MKNLVLFSLLCVSLTACKPKESGSFDYKLIAVKQGNKWGYVDKNGKTVIAPQYAHAFPFSDGLGLVRNDNDKWGYIDEQGNYIIQPQYAEASYFEEGRAFVALPNGYVQCIDTKGKIVFELKDASFASNFSEGLAAVEIDDKYGFTDKNGKMVIAPQFERASSFSGGLAQISKKNELQQDVYGFIDKDGKMAIEPQFMNASSFVEGMCAVENESSQMGYINKKGDYVVEPHFQNANYFSDGHAVVVENGRMGYINTSGKEIALANYDYCKAFKNGRGPVMYNGKWGYVDGNGKLVINMQYDDASSFYGDYAIVRMDKKFGIIDKDGKYLVNPEYDNIFDFVPEKGLAEFFAPAGVMSQYVNPADIAQKFASNGDRGIFRGLSPNTPYSDVREMNVRSHGNGMVDSSDVPLGPCAYIDFTNYIFDKSVELTHLSDDSEVVRRHPNLVGVNYGIKVEHDGEKVAEALKQVLMQKYHATETPDRSNYDEFIGHEELVTKRDEAINGITWKHYFLYSSSVSFAVYFSDAGMVFIAHFNEMDKLD